MGVGELTYTNWSRTLPNWFHETYLGANYSIILTRGESTLSCSETTLSWSERLRAKTTWSDLFPSFVIDDYHPGRKSLNLAYLVGFQVRLFVDRPDSKTIDFFVCESVRNYLNIALHSLSTWFLKSNHTVKQTVAFSSPVSTLYTWNAWEHDPTPPPLPHPSEQACILRLVLKEGTLECQNAGIRKPGAQN